MEDSVDGWHEECDHQIGGHPTLEVGLSLYLKGNRAKQEEVDARQADRGYAHGRRYGRERIYRDSGCHCVRKQESVDRDVVSEDHGQEYIPIDESVQDVGMEKRVKSSCFDAAMCANADRVEQTIRGCDRQADSDSYRDKRCNFFIFSAIHCFLILQTMILILPSVR